MIRLFAFLCFLLLPSFVAAQISESFDDGDYLNNPTWNPDNASNWTILNKELSSNCTIPNSSFYLTTVSTLATNVVWEMSTRLSFNTSGVNYADVYLISQEANLMSASNSGYFLRIGGTADEISLYKAVAGTSTLLINGRNGSTNKSANTIKLRVTRTDAEGWKVERDTTGTGYGYYTEGISTDQTFLTSGYFGIRINQSVATFFGKHFFDEILVKPIDSDVDPPEIQSLKALSNTMLELYFSEKTDTTSAALITNYSVDNGVGEPLLATVLPDGQTVHLTFATKFKNATTSMVQVSNIADLKGNRIGTLQKEFFFFEQTPISKNDVLFTEIMADPIPTAGLPEAEYVELLNRSQLPIDLKYIMLTDATTQITLPSKIIYPGDYVVLTNSSVASLFSSFPNVLTVNRFPTLTNAGEKLVLKDLNGSVIDSVQYHDTWYKDGEKQTGGFSLERISTENFCVNPVENWCASKANSGGTPGVQNSVFDNAPDVMPPSILSVKLADPKTLIISFSEKLNELIPTASAFTFSPTANISTITFTTNTLDQLQLTFSDSLKVRTPYSLIRAEVKDCSGNAIHMQERTFVFGVLESAVERDIVFNELMADPLPMVKLPDAEYVELYNRSNKFISLANWQLKDRTSSATFPEHILAPKEYVFITDISNTSKFVTNKCIGIAGFPSLNNSGDTLVLKNESNIQIDSIGYTESWYRNDEKQEGGWSLERMDPDNTCADVENWIASENTNGGTPALENSVLGILPDNFGPSLVSVIAIAPDLIHVSFNEKLFNEPPAISNIQLEPEIFVKSISFSNSSLREFEVKLADSLKANTNYSFRIKGIYDCAGNLMENENSAVPLILGEEASVGDLVISEILFNPGKDGVDFVEVFNNSSKYIPFSGVKLANRDQGQLTNMSDLADKNSFLYPHSFLVFTPNPEILSQHYPLGKKELFSEQKLPPMNDDGGTVALLTTSGELLDEVIYTKQMHSPFLKDPEGVSLERVRLMTEDPSLQIWKSGVASTGYATPGYKNANIAATGNGGSEVNILPELFEPISGKPNYTSIHYQFDQPGYVVNASIHDASGRHVKQVANNEVLATQGSFTWDGDCDDGTKARVGYYMLWFQVFDITGFVKTFRKRIIVTSTR